MSISDYRQLRQNADQRLSQAPNASRVVLIYTALTLGMALAVYAINSLTYSQMQGAGGLGNLERRAMLSSVQSALPILQTLATICLDVGYLAAMLRVARGQYVSPNTLRLGLDRFWVLLRLTAIQALIFLGVAIASSYAATMLYMLTPLSQPVMELLSPMLEDASILSNGLVLDDALMEQLSQAMLPMMGLCAVLFCVLAIPLAYRFRMANYVIIDKPGLGAMAALRESTRMMRRNCFALFLLDVKQWPYYLALFAASLVGYGDWILVILGVGLPVSGEIASLVFFIAYLVLLSLIYLGMRNRLETVYALAYDSLRPKEPAGGAVLGNIFQM